MIILKAFFVPLLLTLQNYLFTIHSDFFSLFQPSALDIFKLFLSKNIYFRAILLYSLQIAYATKMHNANALC